MICNNCGNEFVGENARFCPHCGTALEVGTSAVIGSSDAGAIEYSICPKPPICIL